MLRAMKKAAKKKENGLFYGEYTFTVRRPDGSIKEQKIERNKIVDAGLAAIMDNLINAVPASALLIEYIAVGTGANAPASGNTQLQTETARKQQTSRANDGVEGAVSTVFPAGDIPTSTLLEAGVFIGGTGAANSGILLSRVATSIAIDALDSLFIDWRLTLSSAT